MKKIPYIIISAAMSLDGFIDDTTNTRLHISNDKDFDRVDALRASCDAILVGANTINRDNPKLLIKSKSRHKNLIKVTLTSSGNLDNKSSFFTTGEAEKIIYTSLLQSKKLSSRFSSLATIVSAGEKTIDLSTLLKDLYLRGVKHLIVEGGSSVLTQFLQLGLVDEMHIAIAGFFVGQKDAPRFVQPGNFPWNATHPLKLNSISKLDDIAVLIYNK
jgi:5-amino-6-(5-phosphoribosylamino)uracil reductase